MTRNLKQTMAVLLAAMMLLSGLNLSVLAEEAGAPETVETVETIETAEPTEPETETTETTETNETETTEATTESTTETTESTEETETTEAVEEAVIPEEKVIPAEDAIAPASLDNAQTPAPVNEPAAAATIYVDANAASDGDGTEDSPYKSLDAALDAAKSGDTIHLAAGTYCGNTANPTAKGSGAGKSLTFVGAGAGETIWQIKAVKNYGSDGWCDYSFDGSDSITFEKMTIVGGVDSNGTPTANDMQGLVRIDNITLKDCTFNGRADYWGYETTTFENVTFNAPGTEASGITGTNYSLWTYTGSTYNFKNCTFNSTGKTINVYRHNAKQFTSDVTINYESCTVNNTAHKKQAMKINDSTAGEHKFIINISGNNTVQGIEPNAITCSRLFGFDPDDNDQTKSSENSGRTVVSINGTTVWEKGVRVGEHNNTTLVANDDNSYTNGVDGSDANVLYTDGYKDNAFTTTYGEWTGNKDGEKTRTVTTTCNYCGYHTETTERKDFDLDVSRSKTATALDSSKQSTVTLSLPSAEEAVATDVVLALDVSKCTEKTLPAVMKLIGDLASVQKETGANIKLGISAFKGCAVPFQELTTLTQEKNTELQSLFNTFLNYNDNPEYAGVDDVEHAVRKYLVNTFGNEYLNTGSNMPAGLMLAQKMLDEDTEVAASRKYMVLISDGSTYLFTHGNDYSTAWSRQHEPGSFQGGLYELNWRHSDFLMSNDATAADWTKWLESVGEFSKTFTDKYDYKWTGSTTVCSNPIPAAEQKALVNGDTSIYQSATFYKEMQAEGYNCYYCYAYDTEDYYGRNTIKSLNDAAHLIDGSDTNSPDNIFSGIENDIIFAVGAGSTVVDTMGNGFDFVTGSLKLTVGGKELKAKTVDNTTYFGDDEATLGENAYRFKVVYDKDADKLTWTINETVSNFAPVQLTYRVKLVNVQTAVGTYGQTDLDGDGKIDGTETDVDTAKALYTNASAILTPVDSNGNRGKDVAFPMPSVSYDVTGSGSKGHSHHHEWKDDDDDDETVIVSPTTTTDPTGEIIIEDEDVPLGAAPDTGDTSSPKTLFAVMGVSALGLAAALCLGKKKDNEDK